MQAKYHLQYLKAGLEELESYLLSKMIYWPIGAAPPAGRIAYPQLTLGNLLLFMKRAEALSSSPDDRAALNRTVNDIEALRSKWQAAWGNKAQNEFSARLTLWRNFLEDYRRQPEAHYDRYAYEVGRRVLLELLFQEIDSLSKDKSELFTGLDHILKNVLIAGAFAWEAELAPGFPKQQYWYLYGQLPKE